MKTNVDFKWLDSSSDASLARLRAPDASNIVFGAGVVGSEAVRTAEAAGIRLVAVCDNSPVKVGGMLQGVPIVTPSEAVRAYPQANFIIAMMDEKGIDEVIRQLWERGIDAAFGSQFVECFFKYALPPTYRNGGYRLWNIVRRTSFLHSHYDASDHGRLALPTLSYFMTERCTLSCRDCSVFTPFFKKPINVDKNIIVKDLDAICACVDDIGSLYFAGGEPLLHPDLHLAIRYAIGKREVRQVAVFTNGSILPSEGQWKDFREADVYFYISDYGPYSSRMEDLVERLEKEGIKGEIILPQERTWLESRVNRNGKMPQDHLVKRYKDCSWKTCYSLVDGRFTCCAVILYGMRLGVIPECLEDYVNLFESADPVENREKLQDYLWKRDCLASCGYCRIPDGVPVAVGVQMDRKCASKGMLYV